jgi:ABC-type Zn uptake system ZnuABC Zn-binding protein ZnuA
VVLDGIIISIVSKSFTNERIFVTTRSMVKSSFLLFYLYVFTWISQVMASPLMELSCSHPEICKVAQSIIQPQQVQIKNIVVISGDPHEYEPNTTVIKELLNAPFLISGPHELNPWIKRINYQRTKNLTVKSINFIFNDEWIHLYKHNQKISKEALSHFWLYPKIYCHIQRELLIKINNTEKKLKTYPPMDLNKKCLELAKFTEDKLSIVLSKIKSPIILTHDALFPLLKSLAPDHLKIVALKGSGHHEEASPQSVKNLYDALKSPKTIWIEEKSIHLAQNLLNKKRTNDFTIAIDTTYSDDSFGLIRLLTQELEKFTHE